MQCMGTVQLEVQPDRCSFERADAGFEFKNRLQAIEHQGQSMKELLTRIDNIWVNFFCALGIWKAGQVCGESMRISVIP